MRSSDGSLDLTDGLQIHLLELPKYPIPSDNRVITDPVEAWLYFFRRAHEMTAQEIKQRFDSPAFTEAAQVLDMIQRTPQQRNQYEQRLKAQRDERARMQYAVEQARLEGKAEGIAEGEVLGAVKGRIQLLSKLLNAEQVSVDALSMEQLIAIENDLQHQH